MADLVVIAVVSSAIEAELLAGLLRSNDIDALASADDAGGLEPQFQLTAGVRVLVPRHEEAQALQVLRSASE